MRTLDELINTTDPAWTILQEWIAEAKNSIEVLPRDLSKAEEALINTQVTIRSLMGAVVYETGGLLVEDGWIRILGSGSEKMKRSLPAWNKGKTFAEYGEIPPYLLVADDAIGGFFAINGGYLGNNAGDIYYFAPDTLKWESLNIGYSDFLKFCFSGKVDRFYDGLRWNGWKEDITRLNADYAYSFVPFLWSKEGKDIESVSRKPIPIGEIYNLHMEMQAIIK